MRTKFGREIHVDFGWFYCLGFIPSFPTQECGKFRHGISTPRWARNMSQNCGGDWQGFSAVFHELFSSVISVGISSRWPALIFGSKTDENLAVHTSSVCVCVYGSKFSVAYTCFSEFELIENFRPLKPVLKNGCFYAEVSTTDFLSVGGHNLLT